MCLCIIFIPQIILLIGNKRCLRELNGGHTWENRCSLTQFFVIHSGMIQCCWWHYVPVCFWFSPRSVSEWNFWPPVPAIILLYWQSRQSNITYMDTGLSKPFFFNYIIRWLLIIFCFVHREKEMEDRKRKEKVSINFVLSFKIPSCSNHPQKGMWRGVQFV